MKAASSAPFKKQELPSDPNRDPDWNRSRQQATETTERTASDFEPKGAERTGQPVLSAPDASSHAGGHIIITPADFMPLLIIDLTLILTLTTVKPVGTH